MERQHLLTAAMENAGLAGTMFTYSCGSLGHALTVGYDASSSRLLLLILSGVSEWSSGWLEVASLLGTADTEMRIQEAAGRWQQRTFSLSRGRSNGVTPLELACLAIVSFEHLLA